MKLPRLNKTGEYALIELSLRESRRNPTVVNARLSLPRRSMYVVADGGDVLTVPRSGGSGGQPLAQFPLCLQ